MRRQHDAEKYELSDAEKRDLIKLINEGKPLPEKYRFLLFEDKREVELVWNGKTRESCSKISGPAHTSLRMNGRAFALAGAATWTCLRLAHLRETRPLHNRRESDRYFRQ